MTDLTPLTHVEDFGINGAMTMAFELFEQSNRRSGRTEHFLNTLRDGDTLVVPTQQERRRLQLELRDMKKQVEVICIPVGDRTPLHHRGTNPEGATVFDHSWITEYWRQKMSQISGDLRHFQAAMSKDPTRFIPPSRISRVMERYDRHARFG